MCAALALLQYGLTSVVVIVVMELVSKSLRSREGKGVNGLGKCKVC
jgi:hypothetical protein